MLSETNLIANGYKEYPRPIHLRCDKFYQNMACNFYSQ
jgi:hypothetical protein